jgi:GTP cyclohydrolase I
MGEPTLKLWEEQLRTAIFQMLGQKEFRAVISDNHVAETPDRVVKAFGEYFSGVYQDPEAVLKKGFETGTYDEMVFVKNISFVSFCAHHLTPIIGKVHFAYLPQKKIVGLSKIPRMIEIFAKRPQVQEKFTTDIVDTFFNVVQPHGCGAVVEALHLCMTIRGIKKEDAVTRTTRLLGSFRDRGVKEEFLDGVKCERGWL